MRDEREKKIESYSNCVNMYRYCSNFGNEQWFRRTDVGAFLGKMCKIIPFFYYPLPDTDALTCKWFSWYAFCGVPTFSTWYWIQFE